MKADRINNSSLSGASAALEMWGGIECTENRVRDTYFDQMERNGHAHRVEDLERIAALGLRALRYPVLWERVAPDPRVAADWTWLDARLPRLRELGVRPIAGLTHHGSGPRYTSLVDPTFPEKLAAYAYSVARRYPWLTDYTPINEPLTTARFSGLYGHWYPHGTDNHTFARALLTQCRAVVRAMAAIRRVNPAARLVQTEDLGRVYSTERLGYEADFLNERRWLSLDLLSGRIDRDHPMFAHLLSWGVSEAELAYFREHPCPPDIMGINHYLTSDRFLDERKTGYPERPRMRSCERETYTDVEAVRAHLDCAVTTESALAEAWERYGLPLAVTEAHLASTREEQMRWLYEVWTGAQRLRSRGADVRAVTAWSVLGAFDWHVLVTRVEGFYEPGLFDVRAPEPRVTALGRLARSLATTGDARDEPLVRVPGWWHRPDRLFRKPAHGRAPQVAQTTPVVDMRDRAARPLLLIGGTGTLGRAIAQLCDARGLAYHVTTRGELDLSKPTAAASLARLLEKVKPWAVVNASGYVRVDDAERDAATCLAVNADGPHLMAAECARAGVPLLTFSTDLVFDGAQRTPYRESDAVRPLSVYGRSKALMEERVLAAHARALVVRTSTFFGPWDEHNFVTSTLDALSRGEHVATAADAFVSPTYVPDLVHASLDLLIDGEAGVIHLVNEGVVSFSELAERAAEAAGERTDRILRRPLHTLGQRARRPLYSALSSERAWVMPRLDDALERYLEERIAPRRSRAA